MLITPKLVLASLIKYACTKSICNIFPPLSLELRRILDESDVTLATSAKRDSPVAALNPGLCQLVPANEFGELAEVAYTMTEACANYELPAVHIRVGI